MNTSNLHSLYVQNKLFLSAFTKENMKNIRHNVEWEGLSVPSSVNIALSNYNTHH